MPKIERPADWPATEAFPLGIPIYRLVTALLMNLHVEGLENYPEPPFIMISNHMSYFDVFAEVPYLPRGIVGMAAEKYRGTWKEPFFRFNALIWVKQFSADRDALKACLKVLEYGGVVAIAPEGTRSKTGKLIQGTGGAAFVATRANVPIVPGAVWGTEKVLKRPRPRVNIKIGKPFRLPEGRAKGDQLDQYTERLMCAVAALLPEQYHGHYAGNPLIAEMAQLVR